MWCMRLDSVIYKSMFQTELFFMFQDYWIQILLSFFWNIYEINQNCIYRGEDVWELIGVVSHPLILILSNSRNMSLCLYGLCYVLPSAHLFFSIFFTETWKVILSFFFLPKQRCAERTGQLDLLAEDFSWLGSQNHSLIFFPLRRRNFLTALIKFDF